MARYGITKINRKNGKNLSYRTTLYEKIPERDTDIHIITQVGDRLDNLFSTVLGILNSVPGSKFIV